MAHTAKDGKTYQVQFYNLDVILTVGYRTNSKKANEVSKKIPIIHCISN
ncbi:MAG: virulence RhuM family protein [Gammaproteobacteria bacterium]|nr:virulence RhuM family protein [Gammaproteobacteria bacterium]